MLVCHYGPTTHIHVKFFTFTVTDVFNIIDTTSVFDMHRVLT